MRRLPVYLLLDTSDSMLGEPIAAMKKGIQALTFTLRQDPHTLTTVYLSIITFDSFANQVVPLAALSGLKMPQLKALGTTALGDALSLLASRVDLEVNKPTFLKKGDWKPLVGAPTDNWKKGLLDLRKQKIGMIIACAAGRRADVDVLKEVADHVMVLNTVDNASIKAFFQWVTEAISNGSRKIELENTELSGWSELPLLP